MEHGYEETAKESARGGTRPAGWIGAQPGKATRQPRKWPEGRPGEKPQETPRCPPQRAAAASRSPQEIIGIVIAVIRARFGPQAIALGNAGIRHSTPAFR
jgi:hypothetical protein